MADHGITQVGRKLWTREEKFWNIKATQKVDIFFSFRNSTELQINRDGLRQCEVLSSSTSKKSCRKARKRNNKNEPRHQCFIYLQPFWGVRMLCVSLDVRIYATVGRFAVTAFPNKTRYFAFSLNGYESWGFPCSLTSRLTLSSSGTAWILEQLSWYKPIQTLPFSADAVDEQYRNPLPDGSCDRSTLQPSSALVR